MPAIERRSYAAMRDVLLARIQPALEQLAEQLVDMLVDRFEQHLNQLELAFDAATSAFASDLSVTDGAARRYDVRDEGGESRPATQPRSRVISPARDSRSARGSRGGRKNAPLIRTPSAPTVSQRREPDSERVATNVPSSDRALQQGQDLPPSTSSSETTNLGGEVADAAAKQTSPSTDAAPVSEVATSSTHRRASDPPADRRICGCALRGRHRKECSLPNISTSPASPPDKALTSRSSPATSPISSTRSDRFAQIEAAKAQRELAKRDRGERARSFIRRDGVLPTRGPVEADEPPQAAPGLLEPVATFEF